ncbi:TRAP transporter large permease subunit [Zwartia sp.]|uniref:TRAP transporter large permease n=1 Tax=Zwartia sp. TaxID=2978004 RepID=UPI0027159F35|nr:TRAP transporter large permease subunit [Zwartia sp.]MDO9025434.1 TRAP transporter large permease subunit [Zwartia sp.]
MTAQAAHQPIRLISRCLKPLEFISALLLVVIITMLFIGVVARYIFSVPIVWIDEVVSLSFLWLAMLGTAIAMHRNEHLRLSLFLEMMPKKIQGFVHALALVSIAAFLVALIHPAVIYAQEEWFVKSPALNIPNTYRVSALALGNLAMLGILVTYAAQTVSKRNLIGALIVVCGVAAACWLGSANLIDLGLYNILLFLVILVALCLIAGVPIAFCFGLGAISYLAFATTVPLMVVIGRMDEGMSSLILVSVPIFVLLGCVLDATGMGKAIVDFLASLLGHIKAGMSYVLLGSLFIVSGISGSKVSDMATIAPALFPEMKRRGHKPKEMIALLATGAAMADTVPPSIVLIVLGSVAGVSIAGLFQSGVVIAMVLLIALAILARWKARHEIMDQVKRASWTIIGRALLIAAPALVLPFLIRSAVGGGVATATEVSTIAVLYAMIIGQVLYGGLGWRKVYDMLVETAALSGAILLILGTASAMAWAITQSGVVQSLSHFLTTLPGGVVSFMIVTILIFLILGCLLEGLPAILILAPIMFPIARKLGIHDIHYSMVVVTAMNIGLMMPPIGIGFFVACRIGNTSPDEVMGAIWPYIMALIAGLVIIAAVPWLSTVAL